MRVIHKPSQLQPAPRETTLAIGFFDGVHLGHQQVIRQAIVDAAAPETEACVVTFNRHPRAVVTPQQTPPLIYPLSLKIRAIADLGIPVTLLLPFDEALRRQSGEAFMRQLLQGMGPVRSVCVGRDFKFGHQRSGNIELLRCLAEELGFTLRALEAVSLDGEVVKSTRIRMAIQDGNLVEASRMLGRPYSLSGLVGMGQQLGARLGFPTANLETAGMALPPRGVYAVQATVLDQGKYQAVANIGCRPTLDKALEDPQVEVHLLDFQGDLYGQELEITFNRRLRPERKFPSLEALQGQIKTDISEARALFLLE